MAKIAIVGGGIMGLSSGISIQKKCPGVDITLISEKFTPYTTGDGAAGVWGPYLLGPASPELITKWSGKTHALFLEIWKSQNSGNMGVTLISCFQVSNDENLPDPEWKDVVFGYRRISAKELQRIGRLGLRSGYAFTTFICEPSKLLPHFLETFQAGGGKILQKRVTNLEALRTDFDIVVNCTGIESHHIIPDPHIFPIRGQIRRVEAPGILHAIIDLSDDGGYVIPNQHSLVMGGTHQEGDWNLNVNQDDISFITNYCYQLVPSLKNSPVLKDWVGLRPGRSSVRLEKETLPGRPGHTKPFTIIHNYGHAGSGVTLFWGCAQDVTALVQQAILASNSKL